MSQINSYKITSTGSGIVTLVGDNGGTASGSSVNVLGASGITTSGDNSHTLTITLTTPVSIAHGGTNATTMASVDGVVYYDGTRLVTTAVGNAAQVLTSNGAGLAPTFQPSGAPTVSFTTDDANTITNNAFTLAGATGITTSSAGSTLTINLTNPVTVAHGGTGALTLTGVLIGNGTSAVTGNAVTQHDVIVGGASNALTSVSPSTAGFVLTSNGVSADPSFKVPATQNISITGDTGGALSGTAFILTGSTTGLVFNGSGLTETLSGVLNPANGGTGSTGLTGIVTGNGASPMTASAVTQHDVLVGAASNLVTSVAPSATAGVPLISNGAAADPSFGTAVVAGGGTGSTSYTAYSLITGGTTSTGALQNVVGLGTSGQVLESQGAGALPHWVTSFANGITLTADSGSSGPGGSFTISGDSTGLTTAFSGTTLSLAGVLNVTHGGTGDTSVAAYSVVTGGITSTSGLQTVSGTGTAGQYLISNGAGALPSWQTPSTSSSAFFAYLNATLTNQTGNNAFPIVKFNTKLYDVGSDYNTTTGLFTAPVTGVYCLIGNVTFSNMSSAMISLDVTFNIRGTGPLANNPLNGGYSGAQVNPYGSRDTSNGFYGTQEQINAYLNAGDTVEIAVRISGGAGNTASIVGSSDLRFQYSWFSGELIGAASSSVPILFSGDTGTASGTNIKIAGGTNISTVASGSTVTINLAPGSGTWSPTIAFGGASVGIVYTEQRGYWQRVGNVITVFGSMTISSKGSSTGTMTTGGMPASTITATQNINWGSTAGISGVTTAGYGTMIYGDFSTGGGHVNVLGIGNLDNTNIANATNLIVWGSYFYS